MIYLQTSYTFLTIFLKIHNFMFSLNYNSVISTFPALLSDSSGMCSIQNKYKSLLSKKTELFPLRWDQSLSLDNEFRHFFITKIWKKKQF